MSGDATRVEDAVPRHRVDAHQQDVPPGFKRTEFGLIPTDWDVSTVGDEFTVQLGKMLDASKNVGEPKPYLGNRAVQWGRIDLEDLSTVQMSPSDIQRFRLREGDLLVCEGGEIGRAAIWAGAIPECYYQKALHRLRQTRGYDAYLMQSFFQLWAATGYLSNYVTQTSIAHLPKDTLETVPLPRPLAAEQRAIAKALANVDGLLAGLEALIAKERAIKQAAMQQLLTAKTRLPGFSGEWGTKRLGRHVRFLRHGTHSRADLTADAPIRYLHYGDVHTTTEVFLNPQETSMPRLPVDRAAGLDRLKDGDLVLVDASEDLKGVGKSVELTATDGIEVVSGLHTIAARFDKSVLADGFKAYLQFCPAFQQHLTRLAAGTKVYATNRAHIASVEMPLPKPEEQTAIANVLSDIDAEITALEVRRDKTRAIKQGMMQQLLNGRVRLVEPEVASC